MTEYNIGNLVAGFKFDTSGLNAGVANFKKGMTDMSGATTGVKGALSSLSASFSALMANPVVLAAAAVSALAAVGKAAFDASEEVNSALDTIRVGTGATGEAFKAYEESMVTLAKNTGAAWSDAGEIIADVATRLDLEAGTVLDDLATQLYEVERMLGIDALAMSESAAKAFQNWNIGQEEYSESLDLIFKASQSTGAQMDALASSLATNGATLRGLGFSFVESAALLGTLEKEGVEASQAMMGFKRATSQLLDDGVTDLRAGIDSLFESIKNAATGSDALTIALTYFGDRAGPVMADAIREGKLELDEFADALLNSDETIMKASADTTGFAERFNQLARRIEYAMTPLGTNIEKTLDAVFQGLNWIADNILPGLTQAYVDFTTFTQNTVGKLVKPFMDFFGKVGDAFARFWKGNESDTAGAVNKIQELISKLTDALATVLDWALTTIWPAVELIIEQVVNVIDLGCALIEGDWDAAWKAVLNIASVAGRALYMVMEFVWNGIATGIENVLQGIVNGVFDAMNSAIDVVEGAINSIADMWNGSVFSEWLGKVGYVSWHLDAPDVPELLKFGDSGLGQKMQEGLDNLADRATQESNKTNITIDTSTGKITSSIDSGFSSLASEFDVLNSSIDSLAQATAASSSIQNINQAVNAETSKYYDSSGNFVNRDDYYSGDYYFADATVEYLDDGRVVMTRANGERLVMGEMKAGDREKYDIDSVFNVGGGIGGLMGNIQVDTQLKREYEAYLAAKKAAEQTAHVSQKPTISGQVSGVTVGSGISKPSISAPVSSPTTGSGGGSDGITMVNGPNAGQTVNITVNGDVSSPSSFAQTVSNIANALSKPLISWFV